MIRFENVTITYPDAPEPTLRNVDLVLPEGELCLVIGRTGVGKSTLLGAVNGLVPHFTGGHLAGRVVVDGRDTRTHPPRDLADVVGMVGQDPLAGFVTDTVEEELAYAMEQLAVPSDVMRKRVEETLDLLGIADLRGRLLRTLSGGQQQRVAIGSVLTTQPRILVLDEPTSALDPTAAEEVLAAITRLVHDLGITALVAEHRLERVVQYADSVLCLPGDGTAVLDTPERALAHAEIAPPVVHLGRLAGWDPLPLSVRDARRAAGPLRDRLAASPRLQSSAPSSIEADRRPPGASETVRAGSDRVAAATSAGSTRRGAVVAGPLLAARGVVVRYGDFVAVREVDFAVAPGDVVALMGRNGSGKSSLLWALQGAGLRQGGVVTVDGTDPATASRSQVRRLVGLVPQTPSDLLYLASVAEECTQADRDSDVAPGTCRALLDRIVPGLDGSQHPRDLSEGERLGLVLAVQLTPSPRVVLLDEPTRGLDYLAKDRLAAIVAELAEAGSAVLVSTHDVEFAAVVAHRVVVLADGEVVSDGPAAEVLASSAAFAPQVAKVLHPQRWLTVAAVAAALGEVVA
ncbi:MAG: ABC transporter ATP-binding protein [Microthrixaceae bacterium]